jgi:hypothetical protein
MSKADDYAKARKNAIEMRPKIELQNPQRDSEKSGPSLFRVSKEGNFEYHIGSNFSTYGERQGDAFPDLMLTPEDALKLAEWINATFK